MLRHAKWIAFAATIMAFALSAAPASAIMVKLHNGHYANYDAMSGAKTPKAARIFDAAFTNLDYSGGPVMHSNANYVVEWLPSNYSGTAFQTGYVQGVGTFLSDLAHDSGTHANSDAVAVQYNDTSGGVSAYSSSFLGTLIDTNPLPPNGCSSGTICITDAQIQTELNSFLGAHGVAADLAHEYYLLTPPDVVSCFDSAGTQCSGQATSGAVFCAYHSRSGAGYVYSNIPDLTGVDGCDPFVTNFFDCPSFSCSYNNGPADGVLSAVSHEHNESITDPEPNNAWTDWGSSVGGENGDKCNNDAFNDPSLSFGGSGGDAPFNEVINGDHYLIQREWSNQTKTCLDGFTAGATTAAASFTQSPAGGNAVTFNAGASTSNPGGVAEYVWQFNDGLGGSQQSTFESSTPTFTHTFPAAGQYWVALTVMNSDGTSNGTAHSVTAGQLPPTAAFTTANGSENVPIAFNGTSSVDPNAGGTLTFAWNFGDGATGSGGVVSHAFHAGFYTVTLTVTDSASGLTNATSHGVFVFDEAPTVAFNAPSGRAQTPVGFTGSAFDPDGSITSYSWTFGEGGTGSGAHVMHSYGSAGTYTVTLKVTDSDGQSASVSHAVAIGPVRCVVPRLKGDTLNQARTALRNAHCAVGKVSSPRKPKKSAGRHHKWVLVVASTNPGSGSVKPTGTKVRLKMTWKSIHS